MADILQIQKREAGKVVILDLAGRLTLGTPEQQFRRMVAELAAGKQANILVNVKGVQFLDSSGVGSLVKSYTTVTKEGGKLKLLHVGKFIQQTLKITGLLEIFELYDDETAALNSF